MGNGFRATALTSPSRSERPRLLLRQGDLEGTKRRYPGAESDCMIRVSCFWNVKHSVNIVRPSKRALLRKRAAAVRIRVEARLEGSTSAVGFYPAVRGFNGRLIRFIMFTDRTNYALQVLLEMTRREVEGFETTSRLAKYTSLPVPYVRKVISELVDLGYLRSRKGPGGGIGFRNPPEEIRLDSLLEDLGELRHSDRGSTTCCPSHDDMTCFAAYFIDRIRDEVVDNLTLADLVTVLSLDDTA